MFKCDITGRMSAPGEKCHKIVVETREKTYYEEIYNDEIRSWQKVVVGKGREIVKELNTTEDGFRTWTARQEFEKTLA
jgi:hypothetical protein